MSITIGIRDFVRNSSVLSQHDLIDIEDKRTHRYKGVFVSAVHAQKVKDFINQTIEVEEKQRLDEIMSMGGTMGIHPKFNNMSSKELRHARAEKYRE